MRTQNKTCTHISFFVVYYFLNLSCILILHSKLILVLTPPVTAHLYWCGTHEICHILSNPVDKIWPKMNLVLLASPKHVEITVQHEKQGQSWTENISWPQLPNTKNEARITASQSFTVLCSWFKLPVCNITLTAPKAFPEPSCTFWMHTVSASAF